MSTSMTIEYRGATRADADRIAELHTDSWRRAYRGIYTDAYLDGELVAERQQVWRERLSRPTPNQFVLLAEVDGELVGFVCAYGADDVEWGSLIDNLHVASGFRRSGIASTLMRRAGDWLASSYPECGVYLRVLEANAPARRFYETLGAGNAEVSVREVHPGGWARSCRYVWPTPLVLVREGGTSGGR
jgi:ribosomal protein S18 acetylase RimI-like enzyme